MEESAITAGGQEPTAILNGNPEKKLRYQSFELSHAQARAIWLGAQRLSIEAPFGKGPEATTNTVQHLGYVQIDTINVIERCHHHILYTRIPEYQRSDLEHAQSTTRTVFEYWTHALSYIPTTDYRYFMPAMRRYRESPERSLSNVNRDDYAKLLRRVRDEGALSIRDIEEAPVEKSHPWDSRKPSKRALRYGFFAGDLTICERKGMLKTYELADRHFSWERRPRSATAGQFAQYLLDRALRSQGVVSLDSNLLWQCVL
ncbi:DNA glycosylase AlkZ-like family protein [Cupriavidus sp. IDO]|uniref:DNA glycosylase AlkZ-like family protein n=1 Tax=Cupriavidus sp. IDO TaxID=1539142 RepID=UPI002379CE69|nr:crosslink repair DNA glycosylase YcaQ family protein [Cupriavidus sp. IDO]